MSNENAVILFRMTKRDLSVDLEVPLTISANDLVTAVNVAFDLGIDTSDVNNCHLQAENPIALLRGARTLAEFGVRNGTVVSFTE